MEELYKKFNFPSLNKFIEILKKHNVPFNRKDVVEFIENQNINQIHKKTQKNKKILKFIWAYEPYEMLQIDLLDYQKYSKNNNGFNYILIAIDIFTRYAWAVPIKNKKPSSVLEGFKSFNINDLNAVYHDSGKEFLGEFKSYLKEQNIFSLTADVGDHNSLGVVDAFSKTFKTMIAKFMSANKTTKYYDAVDDLIDTYNNTPHTSINNIEPINAFGGENYLLVKNINREKILHNINVSKKIYAKIKIGDKVRIKLKKTLFDKGYETKYSNDVFEVINISNNNSLTENKSCGAFRKSVAKIISGTPINIGDIFLPNTLTVML